MNRLRPFAALLFVLVLVPALPVAQEAATPTVDRAGGGGYLVDGEGRSLYLYLRDGETSTCYDQCAENWPPVTTQGDPVLGERLIGAYVGTVQRDDGTTQVTYNGHPLYRYAYDSEPGDTFGHGLGDVFYLVSPGGTRIEGEVPSDDALAQPEGDEQAAPAGNAEAQEDEEGGEVANAGDAQAGELMELGQQVFGNNCVACHGSEGQGGAGPGFVGNEAIGRVGTVVPTILFGRPDHGMPAFGDQLNDEQVAAVATYIRNAWGNDFGPVSPEQVSERR